MKIRTGFVSNSSSASFIISIGSNSDYYQVLKDKALIAMNESVVSISVNEVAEKMISALNYQEESEHREFQLKQLKSSKEVDFIYFDSCNYDTEIFKKDAKTAVVRTCNNELESWTIAFKELKKHYQELIIQDSDEFDIDEKFLNWTLKKEKIYSKTRMWPSTHFDIEEIEKNGKEVLLLSKVKDYGN